MLPSDRTKHLFHTTSMAALFLIGAYCTTLAVYDELISGVMQAKHYSCSLSSQLWCYSLGVSIKVAFILFFAFQAYTMACAIFQKDVARTKSGRFVAIFPANEIREKGWWAGPLILLYLGFHLISSFALDL